MKRTVAITGFSGSGKTTLIERLVPLLVERYGTVAAIKHTHHAVNADFLGDTARLLAAGADPVVLAGAGDAVLFRRDTSVRELEYADPSDLVALLDTDVVIVEGFKSVTTWPRIELTAERRIAPAEAMAILDRIWPT